jgi:TRAP transporter 4TM/12TM fusion protein
MAGTVFLMSEITGIPYIKICIAAAIPALLYYLGCLTQIHLEAVRTGLTGLARHELPSATRVLKEGGQYFIPLAVIVWVLLAGFSPIRAGLWAILATLLVSMVRKGSRMGIAKILTALEGGAKSAILVALGCSLSGMIMAAVIETGLAVKFSDLIIALSAGYFLFALVIAMLACLILGLALSISASYILTVLLIVPAAVSMGVPVIAAHLFVVYYAVLAGVSPPVGSPFFVAASIAGSEPMKTGWTAMRLAVAGFIIPFFFVYQPALLLSGDPIHVVLAIITSVVGVICLGVAVEGWLFRKTNILERVLFFGGGLSLAYPGLTTDVMGVASISLALAWQLIKVRRS